jgi:hypothetical protein
MKVAIISTIPDIDLSNEGDIYMCLPQVALENAEYYNYFKRKALLKEHVILDNGMAEGAVISLKKLVDMAIEMGVSEVIAPDTLYEGEKTRDQTAEFKVLFGDELAEHNISIMGVVQGANFNDAMKTFECLNIWKEISCIGIPFAGLNWHKFNCKVINNTQSNMVSRIKFIDAMMIRPPRTAVHLLGCYNPIELTYYGANIRSCDTSLPIKCAINHVPFLSYGIEHKPEGILEFNKKLSKLQRSFAEDNIEKIKEWAHV